jgi:hypothetical protein
VNPFLESWDDDTDFGLRVLLWSDTRLPKWGWELYDVEDLRSRHGTCQMCGNTIRYVHHMYHPKGYEVEAGCMCATKLARKPVGFRFYGDLESLLKSKTYARSKNLRNWKHVVPAHGTEYYVFRSTRGSFRGVIRLYNNNGKWTLWCRDLRRLKYKGKLAVFPSAQEAVSRALILAALAHGDR